MMNEGNEIQVHGNQLEPLGPFGGVQSGPPPQLVTFLIQQYLAKSGIPKAAQPLFEDFAAFSQWYLKQNAPSRFSYAGSGVAITLTNNEQVSLGNTHEVAEQHLTEPTTSVMVTGDAEVLAKQMEAGEVHVGGAKVRRRRQLPKGMTDMTEEMPVRDYPMQQDNVNLKQEGRPWRQ